MNYTIREIQASDNQQVEQIIRSCLIEYGGDHEGTAWMDPDLGRFSEVYHVEGRKYWVVESEDQRVVGGVGVGPLPGEDGVCELQKMYCLTEIRGIGIAQQLINIALSYAKEYYSKCYLETLENMVAAQKFYEKNGFERIEEFLGSTGHNACDVKYLKIL